MWILLFLGDYNSWEWLAQSYYLINSGKNDNLNPIIALVYIINFRYMSTVLKDLMMNNEFGIVAYELLLKRKNYMDHQKYKNEFEIREEKER